MIIFCMLIFWMDSRKFNGNIVIIIDSVICSIFFYIFNSMEIIIKIMICICLGYGCFIKYIKREGKVFFIMRFNVC